MRRLSGLQERTKREQAWLDTHWCEAIVRASSGVWLCIRELREKRHGEMSSGVVCSLRPWYETVA